MKINLKLLLSVCLPMSLYAADINTEIAQLGSSSQQHVVTTITYENAIKLWEVPGEKQKKARQYFYDILDNPNHPYLIHVAYELWSSNNVTDKKKVRQCFYTILDNPNHPHAFEAAHLLWYRGEGADKDKARKYFHTIATNPNHPHEYDTVATLWDSNEEEEVLAMPTLRRIAGNPDYVVQKNTIGILRESNNPDDQRLGLELKLRYFPVALDPATIKRQEQFNRDVIRSIMPKRLPDLANDPKYGFMDIVSKFKYLMNRISNNENNPYYVAPQSISPDKTLTIEQIKLNALGFLKTLTGQPLETGETSGWQMYDENKPDMFNTLKHLILCIEEKLDESQPYYDPQTALLNLGTILNGMLYCPTGQAEGLQSTVNTLINFKDATGSDAKEKVGKYIIAKSVFDQFNNAFHGGGGVHGRARARMVLNAELNINNALPSFKERISLVADSEIPEFFNKFYERFTPANIISEARRNIRTIEEQNIVTDSKDHKAIKQIKMEKPLSVTELARWLMDQGESPKVLQDVYDITEDWQEISDYGLMKVFIKMGFFNENSEELQAYINSILQTRREREQQDREYKQSILEAKEDAAISNEYKEPEPQNNSQVVHHPLTKEEMREARLKALGKK